MTVSSLASRIGELREKRGISLKDVADGVGVSKTHIWLLEQAKSDNPSIGLLQRLADFYGVNIGYLVGETEAPREDETDINRLSKKLMQLEAQEQLLVEQIVDSMRKQKQHIEALIAKNSALTKSYSEE